MSSENSVTNPAVHRRCYRMFGSRFRFVVFCLGCSFAVNFIPVAIVFSMNSERHFCKCPIQKHEVRMVLGKRSMRWEKVHTPLCEYLRR